MHSPDPNAQCFQFERRNGARLGTCRLRGKVGGKAVKVLSIKPDEWPHRVDPIEISGLSSVSGGLVFGRFGTGPFRKVIYGLKAGEGQGTGNLLPSMYAGMTRNDLIEIELPEPVNDWTKWSLELSSNRKKTHKDWFLVYPRELAPCGVLPH